MQIACSISFLNFLKFNSYIVYCKNSALHFGRKYSKKHKHNYVIVFEYMYSIGGPWTWLILLVLTVALLKHLTFLKIILVFVYIFIIYFNLLQNPKWVFKHLLTLTWHVINLLKCNLMTVIKDYYNMIVLYANRSTWLISCITFFSMTTLIPWNFHKFLGLYE